MRMTILHIQLMLHYSAVAEPYSLHNPAHANSQVTIQYRQQLIEADMLREDNSWYSGYRLTKRGQAYVDCLKSISP